MPKAPPTFHRSGLSAHQRERKYDQQRGSANVRLYTAAWDRAAKAHLDVHPLCRYCGLDGMVNASTLVDHFWPHRGDFHLFWDARFWIESCAACHNGMKQSIERAGVAALLALSARLGLPSRG